MEASSQINEQLQKRLYLIRGKRVLFDAHLAELYQVSTKALNQAVKRNIQRFPDDFSFVLLPQEIEALRSQIVTAKQGRGGTRVSPRVFTEQGIAMLSGVLSSEVAIQVNIHIMRAFVNMRETIALNAELSKKLSAIEEKYDRKFLEVFEALRVLSGDIKPGFKKIGF